jgi:8-oxo-dGTP pyrophosphatase MutT (NUDIX family)
MNIKIYHNNKVIELTNNEKCWESNILSKAVYYTTDVSLVDFMTIINTEQEDSIYFYNDDVTTLKNAFFNCFMLITAGGGVVENEKEEILLMYRRGFWDLPKGKWEDGETIEACALREIEEETGLKNLSLEKQICITYHTYYFKEKWILKESYWFKIKTMSYQILKPQTEEDIEALKWVSPNALKEYYPLSYKNVVEVLNLYNTKP